MEHQKSKGTSSAATCFARLGLERVLKRLLHPRSIAVIGGGAWGANVIEQCRKFGFEGDLWQVHPKRGQYRCLDDLPRAPDASFIGVNRKATVEAVAALSAMGSGGGVCFASGFKEAAKELPDGLELERELLRAAGGFRVLGPNCYGFINALDRAVLWPDQHGCIAVERGVAILSQSSNIALNLTMQRRGLPIGFLATVGNQAQTDLSELGMTLLEDERVTALGLYIEGIADLAGLEALARYAHASGKGIVAIKAGTSEQARSATLSHTASLAGSDAGGKALLERLGIARATSLGGLLETLKLLHVAGKLQSGRIGSLSCSGGEAILMADMASERGIELPPLNGRQERQLRGVLGAKVSLANPLDYHTYIWGQRGAVRDCLLAMSDPDLALLCLVLDIPRKDRADPGAWRHVIDAAIEAAPTAPCPIAILASLPETMPEETASTCLEHGIVPLCGLADGLDAITRAAWMGSVEPSPLDLWLPALPSRPEMTGEAEAKALLGINTPRSLQAATPASAARAAEEIGFPVVLKGVGIAHKSEAGAVVLGLTSARDVETAATAMPVRSYLVEAMAADAVAELLLGVVVDPAHGYVLTLAAGGVMTELLDDKVSLLLPVERETVLAALQRLRIWPVFRGYRGKAFASLDAVLDAVAALQEFVGEHQGQVTEIEVNPLICRQHDALAADALIFMEKTG